MSDLGLADFLRTVITTNEGWFCLAYARHDESDSDRMSWKEQWFGWPDDVETVARRVEELRDGYNVYYSPHLFNERNSVKANVLPTRTIAADLDEANILTLGIKPTVLVETSSDRHQGYWLVNEVDAMHRIEALSKRLTYSIQRCDRTGWFLGKKLRVPETFNYKYDTGAQYVRVVEYSRRLYSLGELDMLPQLSMSSPEITESESDFDWVARAVELDKDIGPQELLASVRGSLPTRVVAQYNLLSSDRSTALWGLMTAAFKAGLKREQVFHLARHSANNKFASNRYGGTRDLAKDVLRAEAATSMKAPDARAKIVEARRLPGLTTEKRAYIANIVKDHLLSIGSFISCGDGTAWYIRTDTGRPVPVSARSESLRNVLDTLFGINATEGESGFVTNNLVAYCADQPHLGSVTSLSYYDADTQSVLLHTGRRDVLRITAEAVDTVGNGYQGVVFPWSLTSEAMEPVYRSLGEDRTWADELFEGCVDNIVSLTPVQAKALLQVWVLTLIMRSGIIARPILALFGQPGSGKSTLFRRVYALIYGRNRSLNAVTNADDFDFAVATDPLVVLDNVDTPEKWLPDRLALSAASSELVKRKLYTDSETVTLSRQALLGITAHNPRFGREDVMDRLLLLTFERLQHFKPETQILNRIAELRSALWGAIVTDIQRVLSSPMPESGFPQFRVEDFARFGYWIACAIGVGEEFHSAINSIRTEARSFSLEEEGTLIEPLLVIVNRDNEKLVKESVELPYRTAGQLWALLESVSKDPQSFSKKYTNATVLGKKLWSLQDSLNEIMVAEWGNGKQRGSRTWRFAKKEEGP